MTVVDGTNASPRRRVPRLRLGALVALGVAGAAAAWVFAGRWDAASPPKAGKPADVVAPPVVPRLVSASGLGEIASAGGPVY